MGRLRGTRTELEPMKERLPVFMSESTPLFFHTRAAFPVLPAELAAFSFVPEGDPKTLALELSLLCLLSSEGCPLSLSSRLDRLSRPRMPKRLGRIAGQRVCVI